jgi:hypothetical protein
MPTPLSVLRCGKRPEADPIAGRVDLLCTLRHVVRSYPMLDIAYVVIGAVFLGACVLYALACEQL